MIWPQKYGLAAQDFPADHTMFNRVSDLLCTVNENGSSARAGTRKAEQLAFPGLLREAPTCRSADRRVEKEYAAICEWCDELCYGTSMSTERRSEYAVVRGWSLPPDHRPCHSRRVGITRSGTAQDAPLLDHSTPTAKARGRSGQRRPRW